MIAIIGIILLIGIVKKNAIMMIDSRWRRSAHEDKTPEEAIYKACLLRFRPDHDDHHGGVARRAAVMLGTRRGLRIAASAGHHDGGRLIFSQVLTLFTTPVIYLAFDRLAKRFRRTKPVPALTTT